MASATADAACVESSVPTAPAAECAAPVAFAASSTLATGSSVCSGASCVGRDCVPPRRPALDAAGWAKEVAPRLGLAGFTVASVTIDRMASQVASTSDGRIPNLSAVDRLALYRMTVAKQTALTFFQYVGTREIKLGLDTVQPSPALSTMVACGITGVPFSSLQYNWAIQDTYRYTGIPPLESPGVSAYFRQKVAPGIFWSFLRASGGTGGGLYFGPTATALVDAQLRRGGLEPPAAVAKVLGSLASGAALSLATQWTHNAALVGGRMAAVGEATQAPHYTGIALRCAWREMGLRMFYLNFPARMIIQAVNVCILNMCDIFHRPDLSGWA